MQSGRADVVTTPFTSEQVSALNRYQHSGWMHPFTCGRRSEHPEDEGILIATEDGWRCPAAHCEYVQNWAHWWMADEERIEHGENQARAMTALLVERAERNAARPPIPGE